MVNFLCTKAPFRTYFDQELAEDFYANVRCALLHEAMTRNGWVIRIDTDRLITIDGDKKTLNRVIFLKNIEVYIQNYKREVFLSCDRKNAFIRKMKCICQNT